MDTRDIILGCISVLLVTGYSATTTLFLESTQHLVLGKAMLMLQLSLLPSIGVYAILKRLL